MELKQDQILFKYKAGSHSYGLSTPQSDIDYRGVYLIEDVGLVIDPYRFSASSQKCKDVIKDGIDECYYELRHFFHILHNANTNAVEMLFAKGNEICTPFFKKVLKNRNNFIDPEKFYKALRGYIQSEFRLAIGERTGKLGGKRYEQVVKLGFSPKNFVQLLRLCHAGTKFFETGEFLVDMTVCPYFCKELMDIKVNPQKYTKEQLQAKVQLREDLLDQAYNTYIHDRKRDFKYDSDLAAQLMVEAYQPVLGFKSKKRFWIF
jgi:predicted nucleotidyltransferase